MKYLFLLLVVMLAGCDMGKDKVFCIDGHEYVDTVYYGHQLLIRFDADGKPIKCKVER